MSRIRLSEQHGVNPSVDHCFICGKDYAVVLFGKLKGDIEAPGSTCTGGICDECQCHLENGVVFLVEVDEEKTEDEQNPWRTGRLAGVSAEAIRRWITPENLAEKIIEKGLAFIPIEAYEGLGIPQAAAELEGNDGQSE